MLQNLKGRLECILKTPELELDGNAYMGKYELNDLKSIKDFIDWLRIDEKGRNIVYINIDTCNEIIISRNSSGKLAGSYKNGETYQKTMVHIPKIIKNMIFLDETNPEKVNSKYNKYSYYITGINMDCKSYVVFSVVGYNEQAVYYTHSVFQGTKQDIFGKAKNEAINNSQYKRLSDILENAKKEGWHPSLVVY
ncbi:MAG: hypothetical protein FWB90_09080 [Fibromonadales bacterium]|nr:hypothetical protein [Fibromonadales bacterium]